MKSNAVKRFCFLVSGGGGPLRFFYYAISRLGLPFEIVKVIGDRECGAVEFARKKGMDCLVVPYARDKSAGLIAALKDTSCDYIITNYNKIIGADVLVSTNASFLNVHPSLLPVYAGMIGMRTVDSARKDGAMFLGATTHDVTEVVDAGKIRQQVAFTADWKIPVAEMYDKTFRAVCLSLMNSLVLKLKFEVDKTFESGPYIFNPKCVIDMKVLDEFFWALVKTGN